MAAPERAVTPATDTHMAAERVTALYHGRPAIADVSLPLARRAITAVIGPSGCGKSTFLRCLNRMHELSDGGTVRGRVLLDDVDIYGPGVDAVGVRRRVGMVFQRATTFPTMSIAGNVAAGLRVNGVPRREVDGIVRIPGDFARALHRGDAELQILVHGADANRARIIQAYAEGAVGQWAARQGAEGRAGAPGPVQVQSRLWFNEAFESRYFLVPGLVVIIMTLIGALLTALGIAREWERGTLEALFVTPVRPEEILLGKTVP